MSTFLDYSPAEVAHFNALGRQSQDESDIVDHQVKELHLLGKDRHQIAMELHLSSTNVTSILSRLARHGEIVLRGRNPGAMERRY